MHFNNLYTIKSTTKMKWHKFHRVHVLMCTCRGAARLPKPKKAAQPGRGPRPPGYIKHVTELVLPGARPAMHKNIAALPLQAAAGRYRLPPTSRYRLTLSSRADVGPTAKSARPPPLLQHGQRPA